MDAAAMSEAAVDVSVDATVACADDPFGPSAPGLPAATLAAGRYALVLCDARPDRFSLDPVADAPRRVTVAPVDGDATVEAELVVGGESIARGPGTAAAPVTLTVPPGPAEVELIVHTAGDARTPYQLIIEAASETTCRADSGQVCLEGTLVTGLEPLPAGTVGTICFGVSGEGQALLAVRCAEDAAGLQRVPPMALGRQRGVGELCRRVGPFAADTLCEAALLAPDATPVICTSPAWGSRQATGGEAATWQGRVTLTPEDVLSPAVDPRWAGAVVALAEDGTPAAAHPVTSDVPAYTLPGFLSAAVAPTASLAATTLVRAPEGRHTYIAVSPGQVGALPWVFTLPEAGGLTEADAPEVAAAHVVAVLADGVAKLDVALGAMPFEADLPAAAWLHVRWAPGRAEPCGTCFEPNGYTTIELSGRPGDPDAWDDAVILHELGHWAARHFGRDDSPGGAHDGTRVAGAIAFSEGFAEFHAAWQQGEPLLVDRRADGPRFRDLDAMSEDDPLARGTSDGTVTGLVSERLVAALLWDLLDAGDDDDPVAVPEAQLLAAVFATAAAWEGDRGPVGFDLVDALDALRCVDEGAGEMAGALARSRGFAYEAPVTSRCPVRSGG
jgi:hypothetical protein